MIAVNQIGYRPEDTKLAVLPECAAGHSFAVADAHSGRVVLRGCCTDAQYNEATDSRVCRADFSAMKTPGVYRIEAAGEQSYPFEVGTHVYEAIFRASLRMLYMQRCGVALPMDKAAAFAHPACHDTPALVWGTRDEYREVNGGWHDAGDYGRYVVPGVKTIMDLFLTFELSGGSRMVTTDELDIPESGNGVPDLLDEARFELEWMLKMQDEATGGVFHKVPCRTFPEMVMPEEEREELVLAPSSDAATADFAAIMFKASDVYAPFDAAFAGKCRAAARRAWAYVSARAELTGYVNPAGISTGSYSDRSVDDEVFFAAVEMMLCGEADARAEQVIAEAMAVPQQAGFGWAEMSGYALYELAARAGNAQAKAILLDKAEDVLTAAAQDSYGCSLGQWYGWGSNMVVANNGMLLLLCDHLAPDARYRAAAQRQLDLLLGCNGLNMCYVSGFGSAPMSHPHHRPSQAIGHAVAGMLAGGPNMHLQDACAKEKLAGKPPALCFVDDFRSYSTNEIAIYWNSPLIFLLGII